MNRRLLGISFAFLTALAMLATPAVAVETQQPEASADDEGVEYVEEAEGDDRAGDAGETDAPPPVDPVQMVSDAVMPIVSIDKEALFARQFNWEAVENLNFDSANEDGSLSEWQTDWFISHDWSDYGHVIADLQPGDAITVNGRTILILGRDEWSNSVYNWDVYDAVGWDKIIFQTCYGDYDIWIAYGIPVNPTAGFLASHPPSN